MRVDTRYINSARSASSDFRLLPVVWTKGKGKVSRQFTRYFPVSYLKVLSIVNPLVSFYIDGNENILLCELQ